MLYQLRMGQSKLAMHYACRLAHHGHVQAVWRELLLFCYTHVGLSNVSFPRLIFRQYHDWYVSSQSGDDKRATVHYLGAVVLCAKVPKNRLSAECASAYLLAATGNLLPEDWGVRMCLSYHASRCLHAVTLRLPDAVMQGSVLLGRAIVEQREDIACRGLDLLLGFDRAFLAWDILFSLVYHVTGLSGYLDTLGDTMVHWLLITDVIQEDTDLFFTGTDKPPVGQCVRGGKRKKKRLTEKMLECLQGMVCGVQFVPVHDLQRKGEMSCYNLLSERFEGTRLRDDWQVRSRPLLFQSVVMLTRKMPFSCQEVNMMETYAALENIQDEITRMTNTPTPPVPNDAVDVYTERGRTSLKRGLCHLLREENMYDNGYYIFSGFGDNLETGFATEEKHHGPHTETDLFLRKKKAYKQGVSGTFPLGVDASNIVL